MPKCLDMMENGVTGYEIFVEIRQHRSSVYPKYNYNYYNQYQFQDFYKIHEFFNV